MKVKRWRKVDLDDVDDGDEWVGCCWVGLERESSSIMLGMSWFEDWSDEVEAFVGQEPGLWLDVEAMMVCCDRFFLMFRVCVYLRLGI